VAHTIAELPFLAIESLKIFNYCVACVVLALTVAKVKWTNEA